MRRKIKFPHRIKPVEREVHYDRGRYYIASKSRAVPVILFDGVWMIDPAWNWFYKEKSHEINADN